MIQPPKEETGTCELSHKPDLHYADELPIRKADAWIIHTVPTTGGDLRGILQFNELPEEMRACSVDPTKRVSIVTFWNGRQAKINWHQSPRKSSTGREQVGFSGWWLN